MTMIILYSALTASFNRYMVECEYRCMWCVGLVHQVLIDTWWNVNSEKMKESARAGSFNRYMVECEYVIKQGIIIFIVVLIDTWWNVNKIKELVITQIKRF